MVQRPRVPCVPRCQHSWVGSRRRTKPAPAMTRKPWTPQGFSGSRGWALGEASRGCRRSDCAKQSRLPDRREAQPRHAMRPRPSPAASGRPVVLRLWHVHAGVAVGAISAGTATESRNERVIHMPSSRFSRITHSRCTKLVAKIREISTSSSAQENALLEKYCWSHMANCPPTL
jgi:hypothetical protein